MIYVHDEGESNNVYLLLKIDSFNVYYTLRENFFFSATNLPFS